MNKIAIFVEGMTEMLFVRNLFREVADSKRIAIQSMKAVGGANSARRMILVNGADPIEGKDYFVLIVDCMGDNKVASDVREQYATLVGTGYTAIIGVRDVFPDFRRGEIPKLLAKLQYGQKTKPIEAVFVLAVMEIESWFISEHSHFERIDATLTPGRIAAETGIDPRVYDTEQLDHPSVNLNAMYAISGKAYKKKRQSLQRTVEVLDYANIYLDVVSRHHGMKLLVDQIDEFLS